MRHTVRELTTGGRSQPPTLKIPMCTPGQPPLKITQVLPWAPPLKITQVRPWLIPPLKITQVRPWHGEYTYQYKLRYLVRQVHKQCTIYMSWISVQKGKIFKQVLRGFFLLKLYEDSSFP